MGPNLKKWLRAQLLHELKEARNGLRESKCLHKEYARRNRGEDGWSLRFESQKPGIWYQEQELEKSIKQDKAELEFLRRCLEEIK